MDHSSNPFTVLDVSTDATDTEIRRAWKRRITQVHPDVAGDGYGDEAARVNEAYRQIATEAARRAYRVRTVPTDSDFGDVRIDCPVCGATQLTGVEYTMHATRHRTESMLDACEGCRRKPAKSVHYTGVTGLILGRRHWGYEARLCKSCSRHLFREVQSKLLVTGWWSLLSWMIAPFLLLANVGRMRSHASTVGDPKPTDPETERVLRGRPVWARPGPIIILVGIVAVFVYAFATSGEASSGSSTTPTTRNVTSVTAPPPNAGWVAGSCVSYVSGESVEVVACTSSRAEGEILAVTVSEFECPVATEWFVELGSRSVACLSEW